MHLVDEFPTRMAEAQASRVCVPRAGLIPITRFGDFDQYVEGYVDHLVSPEKYGLSREEKPLTREELHGYSD